MANFKALAKDTAIYGLSSIVGRFLNYLLVPLYTYKITAASGGYGVVTELYAYTALLLVILTYGMETTLFRFANRGDRDPKMVFSTILRMVGLTSGVFAALVLVFLGPLGKAMGYGDHPAYVGAMAATVALDAFQAILFAYLRYQKKALKFASLKLLFIFLNITLNLVYFVLLPKAVSGWTLDVGYVFYINLLCTAVVTFFFARELRGIAYGFDRSLMRQMLSYTWPLLLLGVAGILNQTADKILFPHIYPGEDASVQLGIYGAATKIAMIMAMITQAFRYAYEPFVFGSTGEKDSKETYSKGMRYFLIFTLLAYLCVLAWMTLLRHIISPGYWEGLRVVPIVMAAEILMGVYFNLSFWYKLSDRTGWGAVFSGVGCAVLILVNVLFVPRIGYMGCAWGGVAGYGTAMLLSYFVGQHYEPVDYRIGRLGAYAGAAALLSAAILRLNAFADGGSLSPVAVLAANTALVGVFALLIFLWDVRPLLRGKK